MSSKRSLPAWHEDAGFQPDMSLFDGPSDKIIDNIPRKRMPTPQEAMEGIMGRSGMGKTFQARNPLDSVINTFPNTARPESGHPTMEWIASQLPPKEEKGGASRKMRKSRRMRRMRRVKSQMRRKNSSRKSTRRRTRK
jgi:hypothetical protein